MRFSRTWRQFHRGQTQKPTSHPAENLYQFKLFTERSSSESIAGNTVTKQSTGR